MLLSPAFYVSCDIEKYAAGKGMQHPGLGLKLLGFRQCQVLKKAEKKSIIEKMQ